MATISAATLGDFSLYLVIFIEALNKVNFILFPCFNPRVSKHFEQGPYIGFFGPPQAEAKNIVYEKHLINDCKRSKDLFFLEMTMILG